MAEIYLTKDFTNLPFYGDLRVSRIFLHLLLTMDKEGKVDYRDFMQDMSKLKIPYETSISALECLQNARIVSIDDTCQFVRVENHEKWYRD